MRPQPSGTQSSGHDGDDSGGGVLVVEPRVRVRAEADLEFYRRKQNVAAVRHVTGDRLVAVIEVMSRGISPAARRSRISSARLRSSWTTRFTCSFSTFSHRRSAILREFTVRSGTRSPARLLRPADKPLTLAAYQSGSVIRAFVEPVSVGDTLIDMPLFLEPGRYVATPLEETYQTAFASVPRRWRTVLESG